jgi:hypothetical protein
MTSTFWHTIEEKGSAAVDQLKRLIDEGNVRRVRIKQKDEVIAEFPLTVGVVGAVLAPPLAAIGAVVALITECSIEVEKVSPAGKRDGTDSASNL